MKLSSILIIIMISLCSGCLYFAYLQHWIVIQIPGQKASAELGIAEGTSKKNVTIFYWYQGRMKSEVTPVIISQDKATTLRHIVNNWLVVLDEVGCCSKKISLEAVLLSGSGNDAYLSFTHNLLDKEDSIHNSWMCIESLLKTIKQSNLNVQRVHFLVHHQPMNDVRLDFSQPWPTHGFSR
jgi:hypothetical protein